MAVAASRGGVKLQVDNIHLLVALDNRGLVPTAVAVVRRREQRRQALFMALLEPFHH